VVAGPPGQGEVNDRVNSIGTGEALRSVSVVPQVGGTLAEVAVQSGQRVAEGEVLARLVREAEQITLERATLVLEDAQARNERVRRLQASGAASDVQIREADLALRQAELALRQAQFELDRRLVRAPIAGWVGIVTAEAGGQVTSGSEITRIDDRSALLVEFRLPERFVAQVGVGKPVTVRPLAQEDLTLQGRIDAIDNRVDATSRTIRVQARIENADDSLRAGMAFVIEVELAGEAYPSVDPLAIQWGREGSFVWVVRAGKAARVPVRIVQRSAKAVLVRAAFEPGDLVIAEGVQRLRPGAAVEPVGAAGAARDGRSRRLRRLVAGGA
jgi:RND family efflux transporter MFP subunit